MGKGVSIEGMAAEIMEGLIKYKDLATEDMKAAVRTGAYAKSWTVKTTKETNEYLELTVCSPKKYQMAHLLEKGHAKRGGGRVKAQPHIALAEEDAVKQLEADIEKALGG